jgi:hypothetical protein
MSPEFFALVKNVIFSLQHTYQEAYRTAPATTDPARCHAVISNKKALPINQKRSRYLNSVSGDFNQPLHLTYLSCHRLFLSAQDGISTSFPGSAGERLLRLHRAMSLCLSG